MPSSPIDRAENGKNALYRMGDVTKNTSKPASNVSKGNADASVKVPGVTAPGTTFTDIKTTRTKPRLKNSPPAALSTAWEKGPSCPTRP